MEDYPMLVKSGESIHKFEQVFERQVKRILNKRVPYFKKELCNQLCLYIVSGIFAHTIERHESKRLLYKLFEMPLIINTTGEYAGLGM